MQLWPSSRNIFKDPRLAILSALIYSLAIALSSSALVCSLAMLPPLSLVSKPETFRQLLCRMLAAAPFLALICLFVPFTTQGEPVWAWGPFTITAPGLKLALLICIKCAALIMTFTALLAPLGMQALASGLYSLRCPEQLAAIFLFMDMNLALIKNEWQRLKTAARLRGFRAGTNLHSYRTIAALLALWLGRAHQRAGRAWEGLLLKGFSGHFPVRKLAPFSFAEKSALLTVIIISGCLMLIQIF